MISIINAMNEQIQKVELESNIFSVISHIRNMETLQNKHVVLNVVLCSNYRRSKKVLNSS